VDIDLGQDVVFKVKYNSKEYALREPTVKETVGLKDVGADDQYAVLKFIATLGLPLEVAEAMPLSKIKKLVETLVGAISEKK
jgi:hypothetical protein